MSKTLKLHISGEDREELRQLSIEALLDLEDSSEMLLCGQILALLDDINTLIEYIGGAYIDQE